MDQRDLRGPLPTPIAGTVGVAGVAVVEVLQAGGGCAQMLVYVLPSPRDRSAVDAHSDMYVASATPQHMEFWPVQNTRHLDRQTSLHDLRLARTFLTVVLLTLIAVYKLIPML